MRRGTGFQLRVSVMAVVLVALCDAGFAVASAATGAAQSRSVGGAIARIIAQPRYISSSWGYLVVNPRTGRTLAKLGSDQRLYVPASSSKLWAISAAWNILGPNSRITTPVYAVGRRSGGRVATGRAGSAATFTATLAADARTIKLSGSIPARGGPVVRTVTPPDRPAFARTAFIKALRRAGVSVPAPAVGPNPSAEALARSPGSYPASQRVAAITSAPYAQDVRLILKVSHNPGANLTICLLAVRLGNSDCEAGWTAVHSFLKRIGMPLNEVVLGAPDGASYTGYMDVGNGHLDPFAVFVNNVPTPDIAQTLRDFEDVFDVSGLLGEDHRPAATAPPGVVESQNSNPRQLAPPLRLRSLEPMLARGGAGGLASTGSRVEGPACAGCSWPGYLGLRAGDACFARSARPAA
jgi:D-Ala-D-Ala carboxypeptidase 3 (S13) family